MTEALQSSNALHLRIAAAFQKNKLLKARVKKHSSLLAIKQKPLTYSEREYKSQLGMITAMSKAHHIALLVIVKGQE